MKRPGTAMLEALLANRALTTPALAWLIAQLIKTLAILIRYRRLDLHYLVSAGGMPSAHSAIVTSLATVLGRREGLDSPLFALAVWFAAIVMYDAAGVRRAVSHQARILNRMLEEVIEYQRFSEKRLLELLGHTPFEVFVGSLLGLLVALTW